MWVYGDQSRRELPRVVALGLVRRCEHLRAGDVDQDAVTGVLLDTGELAQGVLDQAFARCGADDVGPYSRACSELCVSAGRLFCAGSDGDREGVGACLAALERSLTALLPQLDGEPVELRTPEGYAYYALSPEGYRRAAQALQVELGRAVVLGIRSIGTSLGGVVAAALPGSELWSVRPIGDPFRRALSIAPALSQRILADPEAGYVVVDEGPGLSGSSFGAVGDWLEAHGVRGARIHFIAGHAGPLGPHARPEHTARWQARPPRHVSFEQIFDERRLRETLFGGMGTRSEVIDVSGGRWRREVYPVGADWPAANPSQERRKFLCRRAEGAAGPTGDRGDMGEGALLAKFVGLGRYGESKLTRALRLHARGWIPQPLALRSGFLISRWEDATPLDAAPHHRAACVEVAMNYLALLGEIPAPASGASVAELFAMARTNISESLGPEAALGFAVRWQPRLAAVASTCRPVQTDNRLHRWEWLITPDERVLKADALDHHAAHDLVGCQDLAWDVAGLTCELDLADDEQRALRIRLGRDGSYAPDPLKEDFFMACYLAYQLGYYAMSHAAAASFDPLEAARLRVEQRRYETRLAQLLAPGSER